MAFVSCTPGVADISFMALTWDKQKSILKNRRKNAQKTRGNTKEIYAHLSFHNAGRLEGLRYAKKGKKKRANPRIIMTIILGGINLIRRSTHGIYRRNISNPVYVRRENSKPKAHRRTSQHTRRYICERIICTSSTSDYAYVHIRAEETWTVNGLVDDDVVAARALHTNRRQRWWWRAVKWFIRPTISRLAGQVITRWWLRVIDQSVCVCQPPPRQFSLFVLPLTSAVDSAPLRRQIEFFRGRRWLELFIIEFCMRYVISRLAEPWYLINVRYTYTIKKAKLNLLPILLFRPW